MLQAVFLCLMQIAEQCTCRTGSISAVFKPERSELRKMEMAAQGFLSIFSLEPDLRMSVQSPDCNYGG